MGEKQGETGTIAREPPPPPPLSLSCLPSSPPPHPPHVNFACTLLSEYLNAWNRLWIVMLRIQSMNKTCLVTNQVVAGSREWSCFWQENLFMLCISTAKGKLILCSKWRNTLFGVVLVQFYPVRCQYSRNLQQLDSSNPFLPDLLPSS